MSESVRLKVLAIDDEQSSLNAIMRTLRRDFDVRLSRNGHSALEVLRSEEIAVILADQRMPEMSGVQLLQHARNIQPEAVRILITGYTDAETIVAAVNEGQIYYYIHKPWEPDELLLTIQRAAERYSLVKENRRLVEALESANQQLSVENALLHQQVEAHFRFDNIIGNSPPMQQVFKLLQKVIPTDTTVLLLGETGTGKELIARAIHFNGPRKDKLFVAQNCGALPDNLLESELFGHARGAFTGATGDKKGLFAIADGGTVFLDEISDTSQAMQQRLLRVLQEGEVHPLGSESMLSVDVRVVSAANRDLQLAVREGKFRQDLFYRLNIFPIRIPPLRERREDIPLLSDFFREKYAVKQGKNVPGFSHEALAYLLKADYPGNVRQLENLVERAVTLAGEGEFISPDLLQNNPTLESPEMANSQARPQLKDMVESMEKFYIRQALEELNGNISRVAQELGLSRLGLHKKMQRYGIDSTKFKEN
ncbi:MAG TPA: sigma-54 dependent transcriptional regulator [Calditrichia bacterium]|nr:sigma-54-dependent Fis family transcriptional regulator [Calditrichota bacterium]HQU71600.1 sigma-54 dependent transcriptional regulator [Calditrichia bacterium]HQV30788.1 sigma-54 dependent transcriptional regulator [Calditrichia bacterium]